MVAHAQGNGGRLIDLHTELRHQRRQLADAWWYERPLDEIERIEQRIRDLHEMIRRRAENADTTTAGSDAPAQPRCRPDGPKVRPACIPTF
jgi:hypothetical protein